MPIGRILLKSISQSKKLSKLETHGARLLYSWLIPSLDKNGNFHGGADVVKGLIFTRLSDTVEEVESYLKDLEKGGLIIRYEVNGDIFLTVPDFEDRQPGLKPEREGKTTIPEFSPDLILNKSEVNQNKSTQVKLNKSKVKLNIKSEFENEFETLWEDYHLDGKKNKAYAKTRFIALCKKGKLEDFKKGYEGYANYLKFKLLKENFEQKPKYFSTLCTDYEEYIKYYGHKVKADL